MAGIIEMEELRKNIYEAIITAKENLTSLRYQIEGKHLYIFLGNTRCGKSTLINYILKNELQAYELRRNVYKITKVDEQACGPDIGEGLLSKTAIPGLYEFAGFLIVDTPGFGDNRGEAQAIVNAIYINQIQHAASCRFVLVSNINDVIDDNVDSFLKFIANVNELIPDIGSLRHSFSLILTKDNSNYTAHEIASKIEREIIQNTELKTSVKDKELMKRFVKNERAIAFLRMPTQKGRIGPEIDANIKQAIIESMPACVQGYKVGFVIPSEVRLTLLDICQQVIDELDFQSKVSTVSAEYQNYLEREFLSASSDQELLTAKSCLRDLSNKLTNYQNTCAELQDVLDSLTDLISLDAMGDLYATLALFIMLEEASLFSSRYKSTLVAKYKDALHQLCNDVNLLTSMLSDEERRRNEAQRREVVMNVLSTSAVAAGTVATCLGESALTTGIVAMASTGVGLVLLAGGGAAAVGIRYARQKYLERRNRVREQQKRTLL